MAEAEKGQLGVAIEVMQEVGLADILLVGIAKGEERRPGLETMIFSDTGEMLNLEKDNQGYICCNKFAMKRIDSRLLVIAPNVQARITSSLEDIEGVGAKQGFVNALWWIRPA